MTWKQSIPVHAARSIAEQYGWDQVVIIARKVDPNGGEHLTTYGRDKANCEVAARCGDFLKYKVMGWHREQTPLDADGRATLETALEQSCAAFVEPRAGYSASPNLLCATCKRPRAEHDSSQ